MRLGRACNTRTVQRLFMMLCAVLSLNSSRCEKSEVELQPLSSCLIISTNQGLLEEITRGQHQFKNVISSTVHVHLEENKRLEIIAVEGSAQEIKSLSQVLMAKGE